MVDNIKEKSYIDKQIKARGVDKRKTERLAGYHETMNEHLKAWRDGIV